MRVANARGVMKKLLYTLSWCGLVAPLAAQTHEWTGGVSGVWSASANWDVAPPFPNFDRLYFNNGVNTTNTVDGSYTGARIDFGTSSGSLIGGGFVFNAGTPGDSLTLTQGIRTDSDHTHTFALPVTFAASGFTTIDNSLVGGLTPGQHRIHFTDSAETAAGNTLAVDNVGGRDLLRVNFFEGIGGDGSVQVGTGQTVQDTFVGLYKNSTFTGDLRMRNDVTVFDGPTEAGRLSGVSRIFIEAPVDFTVNRSVLHLGEIADGPPPFVFPDRINDAAEINLRNGELSIFRPITNSSTPHTEVVDSLRFQFGHSFIRINGLDVDEPFDLETTTFKKDSPGATAVLHASITAAIPVGSQLAFIGDVEYRVTDEGASNIGLIGGLGSPLNVNDTQIAIVPWVVGGDSTGTALTFLTHVDTGAGVRAFRALEDTQYQTDINAAATLDNVSLPGATLTASRDINALRLWQPAFGDTALDLGGFTLDIGSGALLITANSAGHAIENGTLAFGARGYLINESSGAEISADIVAPDGFTLSGGAPLTLLGTNTVGASVYVNQSVNVKTDAPFGTESTDLAHLNQDVQLTLSGKPGGGGPVIASQFEINGGHVRITADNTSATLNGEIRSNLPVVGERASVYLETVYSGDSGASLRLNGPLTAAQSTDWVLNAHNDTPSQYGGSVIEIAGVIQSATTGNVRLFSRGMGDKILIGNHTYDGGTTHTAGRLSLQSSLTTGSVTGTGDVVVFSSDAPTPTPAQLIGHGRIAGNVSFQAGSVSPSPLSTTLDATGTIIFGNNVSFAASNGQNSNAEFDLFSTAEFDRWSCDGAAPTLTLGNAVDLVVNLHYDVQTSDTFRIASSVNPFASVGGSFINPGNMLPLHDQDIFAVSSIFGTRFFQIDYGADYIDLTAVAVPEPASAALLVSGALGAVGMLRRAKRKRAIFVR